MCRSLLFLLLAVLSLVGVSGSASCQFNFLESTDFPGFDISQSAVSAQGICNELCCTTSNCQAWVYALAPAAPATPHNCTAGQSCCWLKFQHGDPVPSTLQSITSGTIIPPSTTAVTVQDTSLTFTINGNDAASNLSLWSAELMVDVSINLAALFPTVNASAILPYLVVMFGTYLIPGGVEVHVQFMITSPVWVATGTTPYQFAEALQAQINKGTFDAPTSNAYLGFGSGPQVDSYATFPSLAVLGAAVYDAQISLYYRLTVHPTHNNMSLWLSEIKADIAANAAFLCAMSDATALLPFISIQSPAANLNPADFRVQEFGGGSEYTLTFTLSAYITTVTGPHWTPDVLQQGFAYLAASDNGGGVNLFQPFSSGITFVSQSGEGIKDLPTPFGSSTGVVQQCQFDQDAVVTFQATFTANTVGSASTDEFIELIQKDIAWMLTIAAETDPGTEDYAYPTYGTVSQAAFLPYIQVVWPFLNSSNPTAPVIESYSPSSNGTIQPFAVKNVAYFYVQFNLLGNVTCILNGFAADGVVGDMVHYAGLFDAAPFTTPNAMLLVGTSELQTPSTQSVSLFGLPICPQSMTRPTCSFVSNVTDSSLVSGTISVSFTLSLGFPITNGLDFAGKLQADIVTNFVLPSDVDPDEVLPYIVVVSVLSSTLSDMEASFIIQGSVSALGLSAANLAAAFSKQATAGNLSLPSVVYWYGASIPTQKPLIAVITRPGAQCQIGNDATVTFQATFTNSTVGTATTDTFIQSIAVDITQLLALAVLNLSAPGTEITASTLVSLSTSFSIVWPYMLTVDQSQIVVSYSPSFNGPVSPFNVEADWFYIQFTIRANATCAFGGLSAVSVAQALFNYYQANSSFVSSATQLLVSTASLQVVQSVLSGAPLCANATSNTTCTALPVLPISVPGHSTSSSTGSSNNGISYPAGSEAIVFYVIIGSISSDTLFAAQLEADIALNLANITGLQQDQLLPFVVVTNINGTAIANIGLRRLLQAEGPHTSISFVLLATVSTLSTGSAPISASTLSQGFSKKAQQGTLATPSSGASAPAQSVSTSPVGGSSSSSSSSTAGSQHTNGAYAIVGGSDVSALSMLVAIIAAFALLL